MNASCFIFIWYPYSKLHFCLFLIILNCNDYACQHETLRCQRCDSVKVLDTSDALDISDSACSSCVGGVAGKGKKPVGSLTEDQIKVS